MKRTKFAKLVAVAEQGLYLCRDLMNEQLAISVLSCRGCPGYSDDEGACQVYACFRSRKGFLAGLTPEVAIQGLTYLYASQLRRPS